MQFFAKLDQERIYPQVSDRWCVPAAPVAAIQTCNSYRSDAQISEK